MAYKRSANAEFNIALRKHLREMEKRKPAEPAVSVSRLADAISEARSTIGAPGALKRSAILDKYLAYNPSVAYGKQDSEYDNSLMEPALPKRSKLAEFTCGLTAWALVAVAVVSVVKWVILPLIGAL